MKQLSVIKREKFGTLTLEFYGDIRSSDFYMTRDQIGRALEYDDPKRAMSKMHLRYKERLDPLSRVVKLGTVDGKQREVFLYSAKGIYEICRHSDKPNADAFYDFVYDILEGLRLGHFRIAAEKQTDAWKSNRQLSKVTRRAEVTVIGRFVEYARSHGSSNANHYYTSLSNLANGAVNIKDRDFIEGEKLYNLHLVERVKALTNGMNAGKDYHDIFRDAKYCVEQFIDLIALQKGA